MHGERSSFADVLKRHRLSAGLSQEELAGRAGLSPRSVSDLERGEHTNPRPATVRLLADALGLSEQERAAFLAAALGHSSLDAPAELAPVLPPSPEPGSDEPAVSALPTGTVTFLFTDIEGSTRLLQQLGARYADVLGGQQRILRAAFAAHGGHEVDTQGDSFFAAFPTAQDAIACAVAAQRALAASPWPDGVQVRVRVGVHSAAPQLVGNRYVGLDVHRAARIAAAGHGGQVLVSAATAELVRHDLPEDVSLRDLGAHRLKDLQQPEHLYQLVVAGLQSEFPALNALDARPHNLPMQATVLLGREHEAATLSALLRREDVRLVTLTGPGGVGKTRLSVQVAAEVLDAFPDGVWNVRLSRLMDPALVVPTIATTLDLKESGAIPLTEVLRRYLQDKQLLLVLDNFEQVVAAALSVGELLESAPGLKLLVTSRVPLHLHGEREYTLKPLALPDPQHLPPLEQLAQYAAVALFVERAQAAQEEFRITSANAPAVAAICARLDGLPLAIELAAARVKLLPPPALLARLEMQLAILTSGARDLDERQRTMRSTLAWSYDLLAPEEQRLFRRLAVFMGGCTLEAAEAVCSVPARAAALELDVLDGLSTLVDHNLIQQRAAGEEGQGGEPRFSMLHVIREFALEQLGASGEAEPLTRAHAEHFLALAEQAELEPAGPEAVVWLGRLEREHNNLRAALRWARERGAAETGLRLVAALRPFWWVRGHLREGRAWVEGLLALLTLPAGTGAARGAASAAGAAMTVPEGVRARALYAGGALALFQGDVAAAGLWLEEAVARAQAVGDLRTVAGALIDLGMLAGHQGDLELAVARLEESLALHRQLGERWGTGLALQVLGEVTVRQGDLARAAVASAEALALFRAGDNRADVAITFVNLGWVARKRGEVARAEALGCEALAMFRELGASRHCAYALELLAGTAGAAGQGERAARLLGAAGAVRDMLGAPVPLQDRVDIEQAVAAEREAMGEQAWQAAYSDGRALSLEEASAEALGEEAAAGGEHGAN
jgi:predicted ATPase/class 3 adenylate cyclase